MNKIGIRQIKCLFTVFLTVISCISALHAHGQNIPVTINMENVPVKRVMSEIENQTKYLFLYTDEIDTDRLVSVNATSKPLSEVLAQMFNKTDTSFQITESNIVLSRKTEAPKQPKSISGTVKDAAGEPILGATVIIQGTTIGTTTGVAGEFNIVVPPSVDDPQLSVNFLGYETRVVPVGSRSVVDVVMSQSTVVVDEVVVTALGIKRAEKALSYNVQQVSAEAVAANKDANFINALNGKVAGVVINSSSAGVGGASRVIMRGTKSIMQSSNALYVIDGVPMLKVAGSGSTEFGSSGTTDPVADINPEDIESISVLTGAAAAALYGSDAANGAVVVTTKKGQAGRTSVTAASSVEIMSPFVLPGFQNRYGTGDYNSAVGSAVRSWGQKLNSANEMGYEPGKDYFQTGITATESVSLSTGTEKNQTYFSAAALNSKGIVPNNTYSRYNFTFRNTTSFLDDKMRLDVGASYIIQEDCNLVNQGTYNNPIVGAYLFPRGNSWEDIRMYERYDMTNKVYTQYWPVGDAGITMQNPYWVNYRNLRENKKDRYMLNAGLSYDILDWLNVSGRVRIDNSNSDYENKSYASTNKQLTGGSSYGLYGTSRSLDKQIYADALININKTFGNDWSLQVNAGGSISDVRANSMIVEGPIADGDITDEQRGLANVFSIQNLSASKTKREQQGWREQIQSVFASAEVGFRGTYYLTLTGRNDWPSALAGPNSTRSSFFYPSVGVSVLLTELMPRMENLSYMKLRASFASVGIAFGRFMANPEFGYNFASGVYATTKPYPIDLKPERTKSYELGLQMRFLRNFKLDLTLYHSNTINQTFDPQISVGSGYSRMYIQNGNVRNQGIELSLGYGNKWNNFSWDTNYTFSMNRNKIVSLAEDVKNPVSGELIDFDMLDMNGLGQAHFILKEGGTMGDMYSLMDLTYDSNGYIYVDENGNIPTQTITNKDDYVYLGSVLPKANMAWRNDFRVADFNFGFMISARLGGIVFSRTQAMLDYYGVSETTAAVRDDGGMAINGGDYVDPNTWYSTIAGGTAIPQYYIYSATNVRLQEASIGYTIPRKILKNVCDINISIVGRNLWMIYNKAPFDPESVSTMNDYYQGIDYFNTPALRNIGFNLRIKF